MINTLSILIPTYNHVCTELVESLQAQASSLPNLEYEILVADDGSTDEYTIEENRIINQLENCRYIEREKMWAGLPFATFWHNKLSILGCCS